MLPPYSPPSDAGPALPRQPSRCRSDGRQRTPRGRALLVALVAASLLPGCSSRACDALPELQEEREQRRAEQQRLVDARTASADDLAEADDRLHAFERRVFELEQSCERS